MCSSRVHAERVRSADRAQLSIYLSIVDVQMSLTNEWCDRTEWIEPAKLTSRFQIRIPLFGSGMCELWSDNLLLNMVWWTHLNGAICSPHSKWMTNNSFWYLIMYSLASGLPSIATYVHPFSHTPHSSPSLKDSNCINNSLTINLALIESHKLFIAIIKVIIIISAEAIYLFNRAWVEYGYSHSPTCRRINTRWNEFAYKTFTSSHQVYEMN